MAMKIGSSGGSQSVSRADGQDNQRALTPLSPKGFDEKTNTLYEVKKGDSMSALWESGGKAVSWDEFLSRNSHISQAKGRDGGAKLIPGDTLLLPKSEAGWRAGGAKQPRAEVAAPVTEHTAPAATSEQKAERLSTGFHNALETLRGAAQHAATLPAQQRQEALTSLLSSATTMTNTLQSEARSQLGEVATEFLKPQPTLGDIRRQLTDVVMMKGDAAAQAPAPAAPQETQSWAAKARASIDRIGKSISADGAERTEKIRDLQRSVHADAGSNAAVRVAKEGALGVVGGLGTMVTGLETMAGTLLQEGGAKKVAVGLADMAGHAVAHPLDTAKSIGAAFTKASEERGTASVLGEIAANVVAAGGAVAPVARGVTSAARNLAGAVGRGAAKEGAVAAEVASAAEQVAASAAKPAASVAGAQGVKVPVGGAPTAAPGASPNVAQVTAEQAARLDGMTSKATGKLTDLARQKGVKPETLQAAYERSLESATKAGVGPEFSAKMAPVLETAQGTRVAQATLRGLEKQGSVDDLLSVYNRGFKEAQAAGPEAQKAFKAAVEPKLEALQKKVAQETGEALRAVRERMSAEQSAAAQVSAPAQTAPKPVASEVNAPSAAPAAAARALTPKQTARLNAIATEAKAALAKAAKRTNVHESTLRNLYKEFRGKAQDAGLRSQFEAQMGPELEKTIAGTRPASAGVVQAPAAPAVTQAPVASAGAAQLTAEQTQKLATITAQAKSALANARQNMPNMHWTNLNNIDKAFRAQAKKAGVLEQYRAELKPLFDEAMNAARARG